MWREGTWTFVESGFAELAVYEILCGVGRLSVSLSAPGRVDMLQFAHEIGPPIAIMSNSLLCVSEVMLAHF